MHNLVKFFKHLLSASNQHGVHSPFVYDYLTKCLYSKSKYKVSKGENVILKSIPYFSIERFTSEGSDTGIKKQIHKEFQLRPTDEGPFDLVYLDNPSENILSLYKDKVHNDSLIFIENIHRNSGTTKTWETLKENELITVSIDMFYCGALFFRKEQAKEHFKIRI